MFARLMGLKTITPGELHRMMRDHSMTVIDVNSAQSWSKDHVPGASHLDPVKYRESDLPPDKAAMLVFYCSNPMCRKAPNAARRSRKMGYSNVHVMSAGINGWVRAQLPTESGE